MGARIPRLQRAVLTLPLHDRPLSHSPALERQNTAQKQIAKIINQMLVFYRIKHK